MLSCLAGMFVLQKLLAEGKYEYVLDRACVQFEPDNVEYIRVSSL